MAIVADTHIHIHPSHHAGRLVFGAVGRLRALAARAGVPDATPVLAMTECAASHEFQKLSRSGADGLLPSRRSPDGTAVEFCEPTGMSFWILAGRQISTRERLEVHALGTDADFPDGLPAEETIRSVLAAGARPVLAWAVGKWLFVRGREVRRLLDVFPPDSLALGDSALRFVGWPAPSVMNRAYKTGRPVLAGTDPLPPRGEENVAGSYATFLPDAVIAPEAPGAGIPEALFRSLSRRQVGSRACPWGTIRRILRYELNKKI